MTAQLSTKDGYTYAFEKKLNIYVTKFYVIHQFRLNLCFLFLSYYLFCLSN